MEKATGNLAIFCASANDSERMQTSDLSSRDRVASRPTVEQHLLKENGAVPNNARLPLLIYRGALSLPGSDEPAAVCEQIFACWNWQGSWRNGIYPFHHYHSTSHEVLGVYAGHANVRLGGEGGGGIEAVLSVGDVVVIPAGVGHCNLGASADFGVVGAYPDGHTWDLLRGWPGERPQADENIARLPRPTNDPLYGGEGPLRQAWRADR